MTDITKILYGIIGDQRVLDRDCELLDSGLLDSLAMIELFSALEDEGIELHPTKIDRTRLRTPSEIEKLIKELESSVV